MISLSFCQPHAKIKQQHCTLLVTLYPPSNSFTTHCTSFLYSIILYHISIEGQQPTVHLQSPDISLHINSTSGTFTSQASISRPCHAQGMADTIEAIERQIQQLLEKKKPVAEGQNRHGKIAESTSSQSAAGKTTKRKDKMGEFPKTPSILALLYRLNFTWNFTCQPHVQILIYNHIQVIKQHQISKPNPAQLTMKMLRGMAVAHQCILQKVFKFHGHHTMISQ